MARNSVQREAMVVTMSVSFDTEDGRSFLLQRGQELWSDDPLVALARHHSGHEDIVVPKATPVSAWPDFVSAVKYGAVA